jgi:hypothetical protein
VAIVGSGAIGSVVAQLAFWVLLVVGVLFGQLKRARAAVFVLVTSWIAILDIVLVFMVFKGDVRLT